MLNVWTGQGRLTKDIELRYTAGNVAVTRFTIACDRDVKNHDGTREADFIDIVAWRGNAEFVAKYFHKGDLIFVKGRIQTGIYESRDNGKKKSVEVVADSFYFGGNRRQSDSDRNQGETQNPNGPAPNTGDDGFMNIPDGIEENLPFH